jgi:hypothetical protein
MVMKRSKFIKKALNHKLNTVCVNEEQVERMLEVFEKIGMFYCPKPKDGGNLRVPRGWEPEDEEK